MQKNALIRTSALAYSTILALIPMLGLLFAIFKGLGLQRLLAAHLLPELAGGSQEFARQLLNYIESTNVASLGVFGVVWLLVALLIVMTNVEKAFNETWGVVRARPWWRKLSDYLSIFLLFPVLMAVTISITSTFHTNPLIRQFLEGFLPTGFYSVYTGLIPFGVIWVAFIFIYIVIPNTSIRFWSAVAGGIVGGTIWQIAQWLFLWFQTLAPYYNAIFGALYQILFLVIWMFWSWLIVIFGAEVAYAHQNLEFLRQEYRRSREERVPEMDYLGLVALVCIAEHFKSGQGSFPQAELERLFNHHRQLTANIVHALLDCQLIVAVASPCPGEKPGYLPQRSLEQINIESARHCLRQVQLNALSRQIDSSHYLWRTLEHFFYQMGPERWQQLSLDDLVEQLKQDNPIA